MKLRDIIKLSAIMLSIDDVLNGTKLYDEIYDIEDEENIIVSGSLEERNLNLLMRCFNLAYKELATDYFTLVAKEKVKIENGVFYLTDLAEEFYKIIKVEDKSGKNIKYEIYGSSLFCKDGEYFVYYAYVPSFAKLNTELNNFNGKATERIFVYGLNKEYCFISGLYSEAESYKVKFEEAIKQAMKVKKNLNLPKRRWY